jgi:hypothetical protein
MLNHFVLTLCMTALIGHVAGCTSSAGDATDANDPELTGAELAVLPSDSDDPSHVELAALIAAEMVDDDAATFDSSAAAPVVDEPVVDDDETDAPEADASARFQAHAALLRSGLHPRASDALRAAGVTASRITQTIGNAAASAGTHAQDGTVNGVPYSAATDISVTGLSNAQIQNLLSRLAKVGFAAWFRFPGHDGWPASEVRHIHAVYTNAKMKASLRSQVRSWLVGRNGLVSNTLYGFYHWSAADKAVVRGKFAQSASGTTNAGSTCFVGGAYCGGDKVTGDKNTLFRCTGTGAPTVIRKCASGCAVHTGDDDACR